VTTQDPNDLRDPRLDAAWRAASHEEPPSALDDAIRAAARREVHAGPQTAKAQETVPSALRPERWWMPLAAAAAIGVIAVGILQLTNHEQVTPQVLDKGIVSDMPAAPSSKVEGAPAAPKSSAAESQSVDRSGAADTSAAPSPSVAGASTASKSSSKPDGDSRTRGIESDNVAAPSPKKATAPGAPKPFPEADGDARNRIASPAPPAAMEPPKALRKDMALPSLAKERAAIRAAEPEAPIPAEKPRQLDATDALTPAAPAPEPQPFPAGTMKREMKQNAAVAPPPASRPAEAPVGDNAAGKLATTPQPSSYEESSRDERRATAPAAQSPPSAPKAPMRRLQEAQSQGAGAQTADIATPAAATASADASAGARAKVQPKLPVTEWVTLIRRLRDEGRTDEAAKELAAFRTAYPDHERLLPPDLRDWKPAPR